VAFPQHRYTTIPEKKAFFEAVLAKIQAIPGVLSAAETISFPPYNSARSDDVTIPGKTHEDKWPAEFDVCSEEYFKTLGLHLLRGRLLSPIDVSSGRFVTVVNETFARKYLGPSDPLGQKVKFNVLDEIQQTPHDAYFEVIGVVSDIRNSGIKNDIEPDAYIPYTITAYENRALIVRTAPGLDSLSLVKNIREQVWSVDRNVAVTEANTLKHYMQQFSYAEPQFGMESLGAFAGIGLVLAAIGVFSVMGYTVSLQTHEIGIRMALGAQRANIFRMVVGKGLLLVGVGIGVGLGASFGAMRLLASELYGVKPTDPLTFASVVVVVTLVGVAACYLPARRATRVDPLVALRYE